ncbi:hypothetical protein TPAR_04372 [Tolypocladium paradoxum]|uniref:Uncharacterized protein n=1 Tax=Tolypocladium paradoxum TaxID=94208 RepID=A0A2S4KZ35_9HYPO|nr:hypothetical protein TPAR_04372 [Tolypocladium paradoxum]
MSSPTWQERQSPQHPRLHQRPRAAGDSGHAHRAGRQTMKSPDRLLIQPKATSSRMAKSQLGIEPDWKIVAEGGVGDGETHTHRLPYTPSLDIKVGWGRWKYTVYSRKWDCLVHSTHEGPCDVVGHAGESIRPTVDEKQD